MHSDVWAVVDRPVPEQATRPAPVPVTPAAVHYRQPKQPHHLRYQQQEHEQAAQLDGGAVLFFLAFFALFSSFLDVLGLVTSPVSELVVVAAGSSFPPVT